MDSTYGLKVVLTPAKDDDLSGSARFEDCHYGRNLLQFLQVAESHGGEMLPVHPAKAIPEIQNRRGVSASYRAHLRPCSRGGFDGLVSGPCRSKRSGCEWVT